MDNRHIDLTLEGKEDFYLAMQLACRNRRITGYEVTTDKKMILYWTNQKRATPLPYQMSTAQAVDFVWGWLESLETGKQPDHDGDNGKAFHIYNESWGHVDGMWEAFIAIEFSWAMYGK